VASLRRDVVDAASPASLDPSLAFFADVVAAIPDDLKPKPDEQELGDVFERRVAGQWGEWRGPLNRYLAAKAFASWTAYQGRGLLTIVRGLDAALGVVRVEAARLCRDAGRPLDADLLREAFRNADFLLNHLAVGEDLAEGWSRAEDLQSAGA
jgi:hypothetical protein